MQTDCFLYERLRADVARGDAEAFTALFEHYKHKIYSYAYHFSRSVTIAEEVTQDVFLKVWLNREVLVDVDNIDAWLSVITRNICFNQLKKIAGERKMKAAVATTHVVADEPVNQYIGYKDQLHTLQLAMQQLTPQQRTIFRLNREMGLKNEEISRQLQLSPNTVKAHMVSALRKIRLFFDTHPVSVLLFFFLLF
ncbi:RNA polymerase sigma-70 factor, ECF subfamily [Filimonas lacunae]|uniref:RNA polymerase sigma factor n=1 Tax=Filimonas lacunae TaxID=477680 RepID=A0A173MHS8_9BACT|nr:RNA polymerase sigma-70 factor [Filimonas lacunae]BAV07173.1 RNA polymerase ECF-type sigma factor [Filimonas lacunae]SIS93800.1 RNA polymerase sigma-70 factor, ECF subfamily [Filimonas lacunae]